ncbi:universal stress protein [Leptolyngbyaceae cyanobacterium UHCC 1019]
MFRRLIICTDFSDGLQRLVNFVPNLEIAGVQQVTFLHCVPLNESGVIPRVDESKMSDARDHLSVALTQVPMGMDVKVVVECGRPTDTILKVAKEVQSDLIVVGTPIRNVLAEKIFGSTAIALYERTSTPILALRPQLISTYTTEELALRCQHLFRYLMLPYDGSEAARYLIEQIKQHVSQPNRVLEACSVCWVVDDVDRRGIPQEPKIQAAQAELAMVKAELVRLNLQVEAAILSGSAVAEILKASLEPDVSAIAVCHSARNQFLKMSVPSFTADLLRQSWHPVIYLPFKK